MNAVYEAPLAKPENFIISVATALSSGTDFHPMSAEKMEKEGHESRSGQSYRKVRKMLLLK